MYYLSLVVRESDFTVGLDVIWIKSDMGSYKSAKPGCRQEKVGALTEEAIKKKMMESYKHA